LFPTCRSNEPSPNKVLQPTVLPLLRCGGTAAEFVRLAQVMNHIAKFGKILIVVGAIVLMASSAFAMRSLEYLETIDIEDLCISYSTNRQGVWLASIQDPNSYFHTVAVGSHIGKNSGLITKITSETVDVVELIESPSGNWIERSRTFKVWRDQMESCRTQRSIGRGGQRRAD